MIPLKSYKNKGSLEIMFTIPLMFGSSVQSQNYLV